MLPDKVEFLAGGMATDDRGSVKFINDFGLGDFVRFYVVTNHKQGFVRAWHGHKHEAKAVVVLQGAAVVAAVKIDDWENPSPDLKVERTILSANKPGALFIPAGYANGFMNLTEDAILVFFSTSTVEQSMGDDIRFDARYWNAWEVEER